MNFKEVFNLENVGLLSQIALLLFLGVFIAMLIRTLTRSKSEMNAASNLPLESEEGREHDPRW